MWRVLIYLAIIAALASGAVWLADQPGSVAFVWDGVSYSVGLAVAALALLVLVAALLLLEAVGRVLLNLPQRLSGAARERKKRKAIQALSRGMIAVGSGDENAARRHARDAERYLRKDEPLLLLLKAQAAQISGDRDVAEQVFQEMAQTEETRVLGLRGLYVEARRRGDSDAAWQHASEAARLAPAVDWANEAVLEGLCAQGDWRTAIDTVERRAALGLIDKPTAKRQRAVLLTADALAKGEADEEAALASAKEAVRLAPDLVPAATLAGRILGHRLELRKAGKILEAAWQATPHPDLADAYTHLRAGDSARDRMKRAERLAMLSSWAPEGRIALARAALEARDFDMARKTLDPLLQEGRPSVRVCLLMAELARGESGSAAGAREWLARAVHAPRDKAWIADGVVSDRWAPISPLSGHLDAFRWDTPPELISGTRVIDDVLGDLDDRPGTPVAIAASVPADDDPRHASTEAEIIPPKSAKPAEAAEPSQESAHGQQEPAPGAAAASEAVPPPGTPERDAREASRQNVPVPDEAPTPAPQVASAQGVASQDTTSQDTTSQDTASQDKAAAHKPDNGKSEAVQAQEARAEAVKREAAQSGLGAPASTGTQQGGSKDSEDEKGSEGHKAIAADKGPDAMKSGADRAKKAGSESAPQGEAPPETKEITEDERLKRLSRPPDDPGVSPEEAEQAQKRKRSFFGSLFG